jgi:FHA domain/zinc-ribbon domain
VIWRRRRKQARLAAAQPQAAQASTAPYQPAQSQTAPYQAASYQTAPHQWPQEQAGSGQEQPMDRPRQPQVAWTEQEDMAWADARTDAYAQSAARPSNGRLGGQMPSVFCTGCGEANPENARFCWQCGTPLIRSAADRGTVGETTSMIFTGIEPADSEAGEEAAADAAAVETLPPNTALLVVRRGPNAGSRFLLDSELTEVGRRPDSDIFLDDVTVSRRHAEFYRHGGRFAVRDVGSLNGTYVNRERIEETALSGGDEVQIGKFRLVFLQGRLSHADAGG